MRTTIVSTIAFATAAHAFPFNLIPYAATLAEPSGEGAEPVSSGTFWWKVVISMGLVLLGGVFAG